MISLFTMFKKSDASMKNINIYYISIVFCIAYYGQLCPFTKFVIITASYNNEEWCEKNVESVLLQDYPQDCFTLIYRDDSSTDKTFEKVENLVKKLKKEDQVNLIKNSERKGALENQYEAIHSCLPTEVCIIADGDDWFPDRYILRRLNEIYENKDVWLTYGQFIEYPSCNKGFCCLPPEDMIRNHSFRKDGFFPSHLRTFYAGLFHKIHKEDLVDKEGHFFIMAGDVATMLPMLEMAADHFRFNSDVMLVYNCSNPFNDHKISRWLQSYIDSYIRSKPAYAKLERLF